jgi:RHS repeat-associated protein
VKATVGGVTTVYIGNHFEWSGSTGTMVKYFYAGTQRVAMKKGSTVYFLLGDHLGSTSWVVTASGGLHSEQRYDAWGEKRPSGSSTLPTTFRFTGQRQEDYIKLYWYGSRWYDSRLGRFIQPDPIIPEPYNPLAFDRYQYANNNPVKYIDPTGHISCEKLGTEKCDEKGNFVNDEPPPVVKYIYKEMMKNSQ